MVITPKDPKILVTESADTKKGRTMIKSIFELQTKLGDIAEKCILGEISDSEWRKTVHHLEKEWYASLHETYGQGISELVHEEIVAFLMHSGGTEYEALQGKYRSLIRILNIHVESLSQPIIY